MFFAFRILPVIVAILMCLFLYRYMGKLLSFKNIDPKKHFWIAFRILIITVLTLWGKSFFSLPFITVAYMMLIHFALYIITLIFKLFSSYRYEKSSMRKIYESRAVPVFLALAIGFYGYYNMNDVILRNWNVNISKSLNSEYNIAMFSDLHLGTSMNANTLGKKLKVLKGKDIDMLLLVGDLFDESTEKDDMIEACKEIGKLKFPKGTYYVFGNHDARNFGKSPEFTKEELIEVLSSNGIKVLEDEALNIGDDLILVGRSDIGYGPTTRKPLDDIISKGRDKAIIVMDHQPKAIDEAISSGVDLLLSGHTHAGQIWPAGLFIKYAGLYKLYNGFAKYGSTNVLVSSGIAGWKINMRTEDRSAIEIIHLKGLKSKSDQ